ncbi:hypothetical protein CDEST_13254 [Colletotrichum destructivum]|uniref:Uncharacterized protein n=1 Tax=Colletotrichum destructivum TaxID=34406 RepID=A0AAX4IYB8_9PEZI|nr:hypothetical protein CDEST_13254 [Colletotrichum destructivum]
MDSRCQEAGVGEGTRTLPVSFFLLSPAPTIRFVSLELHFGPIIRTSSGEKRQHGSPCE